MYYKTQKGTAPHAALDALYAEISASRAAIRAWMEVNQVESYKSHNINLTDYPVVVKFKSGAQIPEGWKYSTKYEGYKPDSSKAGKAIAATIAALPIVGRMKIGDVFKFEAFYTIEGGNWVMKHSPSVHAAVDTYLVAYDNEYTGFIPDDLVEITGSEYKKLLPKK